MALPLKLGGRPEQAVQILEALEVELRNLRRAR
jgi:hypothetical protein